MFAGAHPQDQLRAGHGRLWQRLFSARGSGAVEAVGKLCCPAPRGLLPGSACCAEPGRGARGSTSAASGGCGGCGSRMRWGRTGRGRGHRAVCFLGVGAGGSRAACPGQTGQQHSGGGDGWWFFFSALDDFPVGPVLVCSLF